jgi:hypothetical protein
MTDRAISDYLAKLGRKGAASLNAKLTPKQRKESASNAAKARWA